MDIKNIILIVIAFIDFIVGLILIFRNTRSAVNATFAMTLFGAGVWAFGIAMFRSTLDIETAVAWVRIYYFAPTMIILAFLAFANYYIYKLHDLDITKTIYYLLPFLFIILIIFHPTFFIEKATHYDWGNDANEKIGGHLIYALYFFIYLFIAYKILINKFKNSDGINRRNLLLIILFTIISFTIGIIFDLILPILGNYKLIWVGPNFSILVSMFLIYLIFYRRIRVEQ